MKTLGILGGGQLGMMMMPFIKAQGIHVSVLDPNPNCSCAELADTLVVGDFHNYQTVLDFGQTVDIITVEIEHINVDALEELEKQGKLVRPNSKLLRIIQNKGLQKQFFVENKIPTSEFVLVHSAAEVESHTNMLPIAQKTCTGGYDGQGVQLLKTETDLAKAFNAPSVLEKLVDIDQELSVIVAQNTQGEIKTFPTVGQDFDEQANLVKFVYAPANISSETDNQCQSIAKNIAEKFELEGILAIEFFLDTDGNTLVNEVAPRAHNSGHWSIEGAHTSQFEQLIRAIYDLELGDTNIKKPSVMVNLLGAEDHTGTPLIKNFDQYKNNPNIHLHWYNKTQTRPWRKMGHITVTADTIDQAKTLGEEVYKTVRIEAE